MALTRLEKFLVERSLVLNEHIGRSMLFFMIFNGVPLTALWDDVEKRVIRFEQNLDTEIEAELTNIISDYVKKYLDNSK